MYPEINRLGTEVVHVEYVVRYRPKHAIWEEDLDVFIYAMREQGIYQKLLSDNLLYRKERSSQHKQTEKLLQSVRVSPGLKKIDQSYKESETPLSPSDFMGTEVFGMVGISVTFIVFIFEVINGIRVKRRAKRKWRNIRIARRLAHRRRLQH